MRYHIFMLFLGILSFFIHVMPVSNILFESPGRVPHRFNGFHSGARPVLTRLVYSCWPNPKNSFIETHIRPTPDLYGPVWVCVTLVFAVGMCSNLADYIQSWLHGNHTHWHYDFHLVTLAATLVACYVLLAPAAIYSLLWYRRVPCRYTAFELLSAYGYSMAVFVPASLCLVVDLSPVRWLSLLAAAALSGLTLAMAIKPTLECPKALATFVLGFVLAAHSLFALFLGLAFSGSELH